MPVREVIQESQLERLEKKEPTVKNYMKQNHSNKDLDKLKKCKGIKHYTRGGEKTIINSDNIDNTDKVKIKKGDILLIAKTCTSGSENEDTMGSTESDYAFIMPSRTSDDFGHSANEYMEDRPSTEVIPSDSSGSMSSVLDTVISGSNISTTINDLVIVSHASHEGILFFSLDDQSDGDIDYYDLSKFVSKYKDEDVDYSGRPEITSRYVGEDSDIHIRGCSIGREERFLKLMYKLFGKPSSVTAPRHIDRFRTHNSYVYEYMMYEFPVFTNESPENDKDISRDEIINGFRKKADQDIFSLVNDQSFEDNVWDSWIPENIKPSGTVEFSIDNLSIPGSLSASDVKGEYSYEYENTYGYEIRFQDEEIPEAREERMSSLRNSLADKDSMGFSYPSDKKWGYESFPVYEKWGYDSVDEFVDRMYWKFSKNDKGNLVCSGYRSKYELVIPVTHKDNKLIVNIVDDNGYKRNDLSIENNDLFGVADSGPDSSG